MFGLREDTGLTGSQYSWLGAIFYLGYGFWEWPTAVLLQKLPLAKFLGGSVSRSLHCQQPQLTKIWKIVVWGAVLICHAAAHDFPGLAAARFFLGVFEASIQPVTMVIFTLWYKRIEQPLRIGIWIGCAGLGYIVAGIASFGIGHIDAAYRAGATLSSSGELLQSLGES